MFPSLPSKFFLVFFLSILVSFVAADDDATAIEYGRLRLRSPDTLATRDTNILHGLLKRQTCAQQGEGDCPAPIGQCCPVGNTCCSTPTISFARSK
ncbi:hypothetical protein SCHPADRAFT_906361 [Schizopora paradoxa]|uniref:Hydrophobin n=1 Tax=Schizopora paradoxa TaxID=27342 RepID=A0A0H2RHK7_9AGAM|nr:hypothetical protein SCHPADRAFT_906361 [Schizopora paradoxa]